MTVSIATKRTTQVYRATVKRKQLLCPSLMRIFLEGPELVTLHPTGLLDAYVTLLFPHPDCPNLNLRTFDRETSTLPAHFWPISRSFTLNVTSPDEVFIDFVLHGEHGIAGTWAQHAKVGYELYFTEPKGRLEFKPDAPWHLLAGDLSALPVISRVYDAAPPEHRTVAVIEIDHAADALPLKSYGKKSVTWLLRDGRPRGGTLLHAIRKLDFSQELPHCVIHGEVNLVKTLRQELHGRRRIPLAQMTLGGYWQAGRHLDPNRRSRSVSATKAAADTAA